MAHSRAHLSPADIDSPVRGMTLTGAAMAQYTAKVIASLAIWGGEAFCGPEAMMKLGYSRASAAAAVLSFALVGFGSAAQAGTLWDNNGPSGGANLCSSNANTCGSNGWTIYDDFQLTAASTVTGFTYDSDFTSFGSVSDYVSTNWSIWSADPVSNFAAGPLVSGTSTGLNSVDAVNFTLTTITGLNVNLGAGIYWLGIQNNVDNGQITAYISSGTARLGRSSQSDNSGTFFNASNSDASFTVQGNGAVPEPATWAMMLVGFGGLGAVLRRRRTLVSA